MSLLNLISLVGLIVFGFTAWVLGGFRRPVAWSTVLGSGLLMLALGSLIFLFPPTRSALAGLNDLVVAVLGASRAGAIFLFGPLGLNPGETVPTGETSIGLILAVQVFPAVIFFSSRTPASTGVGAATISTLIMLRIRILKTDRLVS